MSRRRIVDAIGQASDASVTSGLVSNPASMHSPTLANVVRGLAFLGDLSMGQAIDHSPRVASLARRLAGALGWATDALPELTPVALLRWAGCTANADVAAAAVADDVQDRATMLALRFDRVRSHLAPPALAEGRCDSNVVGALVGLPANRAQSPRRTPLTDVDAVTGPPAPAAAAALSEREADVLRCVSLGHSNKQAARLLGISPSTVRTHLESVFRKLDCRSRAAATLKAVQLGAL